MLLWNESFATGHPVIDRQHQTLLLRVGDLSEAIRLRRGAEEMRRTLSAMSVYVGIHFQMEEDLMRQVDYPGLADHQAKHANLRTQVEALVDRCQEGSLGAEELLSFLERWLTAHMLGEDRDLATFVRGRAESEATA
jgi:hemerythrin